MNTVMKRYRIDVLTLNVPAMERLAGTYLNAVAESDEAADTRTYIDPVSREEAESFWQLSDEELEAYYAPRTCSYCQAPIAPRNGLWGFEAVQQRVLRDLGRWNDSYQRFVFDTYLCQMRHFVVRLQSGAPE